MELDIPHFWGYLLGAVFDFCKNKISLFLAQLLLFVASGLQVQLR
jgi:hypothetical protein